MLGLYGAIQDKPTNQIIIHSINYKYYNKLSIYNVRLHQHQVKVSRILKSIKPSIAF